MVKIKKENKKSNYQIKKSEETQDTIKKIRLKSEEEKTSKLADEAGLPYLDVNIIPIDPSHLSIMSKEDIKRYGAAVIHKDRNKIRAVTIDPYNKETEEFLEKIKGNLDIEKFVISKTSFKKLLQKYEKKQLVDTLDYLNLTLTGEELKKFEADFKNLLDLKNKISEIPISDALNIIMVGAIKMGASDVHFEPQEKEVRLRYRLDGVLQDISNIPTKTYNSILSRIKMLSEMKINIRDIAQDGHFSIFLNSDESQSSKKEKFDIRVNIIPGNHGESIVMRLLDQSDTIISVEDLGLRGLAYEQVKNQISKPNGIILTTGPTGSGKTTTLYSLLNKLNTPDVKIITIENPIEYQIKGISQTQTSKNDDYTFAKGLRAIVRQDPDVVLVGEIRDEETAEVSINAALTGHLVLSTLHTNNAAGSISRLIEMGVRPSVISSAVNAFIAQRLVRKLCPHCREEYAPAEETISSIKKLLSLISPKANVEIPKNIKKLYRPKGCPKCHNLGYKGRIGIFEVLTISETIEEMTINMEGEGKITQAALEDGMITLTQDGILKAVEGITSMEEVWRVTGQTDFLEDLYNKLMAQSLSNAIKIPETDLDNVSKYASSFEEFEKFIQKSNQKDAFRLVMAGALLLGVGDIHIEPEETKVNIRFRIDGVLQTAASIPINEYPSFLGELKMICGLKSEVRQGVQDSRFAIELEKPYKKITETKTDVRVSIILGGSGETVVMRILNKSAVALDVKNLGIRKQNLERLIHEIKKPNGFFLNTGPTGSGKTTTLYSILGLLNKPEVKIITVEDPIEYQLSGILQTQANGEEGYTFSTALKSLMRQNPDIIMVGEIRDEETADIAVQASLTGHFVLSTLHTNSAAATIPRLINMNVRPDDLATSANAFMAQRLVRKLCDCKTESKPSEEEKEFIKKELDSLSSKSGIEVPTINSIYKPKGCSKCNNIGYKGRTTLSEVLVIDRDIENLISQNALSSEINQKAVENGMITMAQDGALKIIEGETTLDEVKRVVEE